MSIRSKVIAACMSIGLAGCAAQYGSALDEKELAQLWTDFSEGRAELSCGTSCAFAWGLNRQRARSLHDLELWADLALLVLRVGHRLDQTRYYLGRAAEGLGYLHAAAEYYNASIASVHDDHCGAYFPNCDGLYRFSIRSHSLSISELSRVRA